MNNLIVKYSLLLFCIMMISCDETKKKTTTTIQEVEKIEVSETKKRDNTYFLDYNGVDITLPPQFKEYSLSTYLSTMQKKLAKGEMKMVQYRIDKLEKIDGSLYLFLDTKNNKTISVKATTHSDIDKNDAQELLNSISLSNQKIPTREKLNIEKLEAKFNGKEFQQVLKTAYKFSLKNGKKTWYVTNYVVSSNKKTVLIEITENELGDYNDYIEKIAF